jgi:HK97 family phage major capsid protein
LAEARALSNQDIAAGAITIANDLVRSFELAMLQFGGVRQVAEVMRTASGGDITWPTANDTTNTGAGCSRKHAVVTERTSRPAASPGRRTSTAPKLVKVPVELLEDSVFDLPSVIGAMLGERIGRITNTHFTTGNSAGKPNGIVTAATLGKTAAGAAAITSDEILDLIHSIDPAYRTTGCGFMMNDAILLAIRKLKDGQGNYLWTHGDIQTGTPDRLFTYPITVNQDMATLVTTGKTILFGQLNKYKVRDVASFRLRRLVERYADNDQEGFVAFSRHDGNLLDAGTHPVKYLQQA